ncbi:hypothetical protein DSO57_1005046 [Entomophthora muscae]|uniref:Uncharacterized protein n=1 Tax=Entomophthora muscae TaxID=34485 RepID=A0ACC2UIY5_9FUNG|nr:hypothetical protein DSO57_1005046 [Entomophthora muscae]
MREEIHSEVVLTQLVQRAQAARKPTKVITIKKGRNKEVELTLYVFDAVYCQESVLSAMMEKVKPVLDTSYKPYISDGNQEANNKCENCEVGYKEQNHTLNHN